METNRRRLPKVAETLERTSGVRRFCRPRVTDSVATNKAQRPRGHPQPSQRRGTTLVWPNRSATHAGTTDAVEAALVHVNLAQVGHMKRVRVHGPLARPPAVKRAR